MHSKLLKVLITGLFTGAGVRAIQFAMHVILARELGLESYGLFTYALGLALFLSHLVPLGWHVAITRFVGEYREKQEWALYRGAVRASYEACLLAVAAAVGLMLLLAWLLPVPAGVQTSMLYGTVLLPVLTISRMLRRQLIGLGAAKAALFLDDAFAPLVVTGVFLVVGGDVVTVLSTYVLCAVAAALAAFALVRRTTPAAVRAARERFRRREWWGIAVPNILGTASRRAMNRIDILMVGPFLGVAAVGIYSVAFRLNYLLAFMPNIIGVVLSSRLTRSYYRGDLARTRKLFVVGLGASLALSLPIALAMLVFPEILLRWTFGAEFVTAAPLLQIIALGQLANAASGPTSAVLTLTGRQNAFAYISVTALILNVLGNLVAVLTVGLVGVAAVTAATLTLQNVWQFAVVAGHLQLLTRRPRPAV